MQRLSAKELQPSSFPFFVVGCRARGVGRVGFGFSFGQAGLIPTQQTMYMNMMDVCSGTGACLVCRGRKRKCKGSAPFPCEHCLRHGKPCEYVPSRRNKLKNTILTSVATSSSQTYGAHLNPVDRHKIENLLSHTGSTGNNSAFPLLDTQTSPAFSFDEVVSTAFSSSTPNTSFGSINEITQSFPSQPLSLPQL